MRVTEDMRRRAVDALDACRHSGQPWFKLLANEVVEIALNAALAPWRTNTTTSSFASSSEGRKEEPSRELLAEAANDARIFAQHRGDDADAEKYDALWCQLTAELDDLKSD